MPKVEDQTKERILLSALALFAERGIGKTSVSEVAYRAGVTRVTVYRYFPEKKELVYRAFLRVEQVFQQGLAALKRDPKADWEGILNQIGEELGALPPGDVFERMDELKRLYPDVCDSIQQVREITLNAMFERFIAAAQRRHLLRPGLNRAIVQAVFSDLLVNLFDHPRFKSLGLTDAELYRAMSNIFLHGVMRSR